jgi:hypothetical protein
MTSMPMVTLALELHILCVEVYLGRRLIRNIGTKMEGEGGDEGVEMWRMWGFIKEKCGGMDKGGKLVTWGGWLHPLLRGITFC